MNIVRSFWAAYTDTWRGAFFDERSLERFFCRLTLLCWHAALVVALLMILVWSSNV